MLDIKTYLETLAAKWIAKYPQSIDRISRGLALALSPKVAPRGLDSWRVCGSKPRVEYLVEVLCGFPSCTCPDFIGNVRRETPIRCKHIWACALLTRLASELSTRRTVRPLRTKPAASLSDALSVRCRNLHDQNHRNARHLSLVEGASDS